MSHTLSNLAPTPNCDAAAADAPLLLLVPSSADPTMDQADPVILGLGLLRRIVSAARAAGYRRAIYLSPDDAASSNLAVRADWSGVAALVEACRGPGLVIVPGTILAETGWLGRLAAIATDARAWAAKTNRIIVLPGAIARQAVAVLGADGDAYDLAAMHDRLQRRFGPPADLPTDLVPMVVMTPDDVHVAERHLLRSVVKETDGFMARHVERPISLAISQRLSATAVTPNQMTLVSLAVGLAGAPFFLSAGAAWQTVGALLLLAHSILDGCDGELARLKFQESRWGGVLDFWADNIVHCAIFGCMAAGWSRAGGGALPLWLGAAAVLGTAGSAGFVYWRVIRRKDGTGPVYTSVSTAPSRPLTRLLDTLSRRDFIYVVLALALFGKVSWFLLLTAFGAPTFLFLLVVVAWREGAATASV